MVVPLLRNFNNLGMFFFMIFHSVFCPIIYKNFQTHSLYNLCFIHDADSPCVTSFFGLVNQIQFSGSWENTSFSICNSCSNKNRMLMEAEFHNSGTFKDGNDINTLLRIDSEVSIIPFLDGTKGKCSSVGASSATTRTSITLTKEPDDAFSLNLEVGLPLGKGKKLYNNLKKIDFQLSPSSRHSSVSSIDMYTCNQNGVSLYLDQGVKEISPASTTNGLISSATCASGNFDQTGYINNNSSICLFWGCEEAGGKSGLCNAHCGGWHCSNGAEDKTVFGKAHNIKKRCKKGDCSNSAAKGASGLCISHGGGRRCQFPECTKGAQDKLFCKAHGGGKRCTYEGCNKSAESGSAQFCKGHGGGKRCLFSGGGTCPKSAREGSLYCVTHGGGKRCNVPDCTKSARGRTDLCARHGGGKRCSHEGCEKSVLPRTDFCVRHGGKISESSVNSTAS